MGLTFSPSQQSEFSFSAIKRKLLGVLFCFFGFKSCLKVTLVCEIESTSGENTTDSEHPPKGRMNVEGISGLW